MLDPREREIVEKGYSCLESSFLHWLDVYAESHGKDFNRASKALNMMHIIGEVMEDTVQIMHGTMGYVPGSVHSPKMHGGYWANVDEERAHHPIYAAKAEHMAMGRTKPHEG